VNSGQLTDPQFNDNNDAGTWTVTIVNPGGQSSSAFNFTVSGAAPSVSGVSPNPVPGSNNAQQLTINGSNFASGATATYHDPQGNSYPGHSTTFVNSGQLTDPQFNDNNDAGTWTVTIVNPGGQSSSAFNFTVSGAAPSVSGVSPNPVPGSNNAQQLTINGSNFASGATATYHDPQGNSYPGHSTTFVNSGQLTDPQFNDNNDAGTWTVTIVNPGGQSSSAFNFTVSGAAPSVSGVSPNPVPGSNNAQQLTINGSNFASGATATYHDPQGNSYPGHSTTFVNSGQLTDPQFNDNNDAGTWTVTIVNPGGQSSSAFNFTVSGAAPSVSGVSPNPVPGSNNAQQLTINGSNFASGATATYHDPQGNSYPGHSTTFVNSGQLTDPQFNDNNDAGTWTVTIVNPGGQSSSAFNFTVSGAAPSVSGVSPNPVPGSNNAQQLTINGSNFASGATATYHDPQGNSYPGHSTTFVNSGQLTDPQFNDNNDAGTWTVTIVNPGGQSSSAFNFTVSGAAPSVSGVSPNPVPGSNNAQQLTINGSNFASGATATYHDPQGNSYPGHSTTFVNSGQLTDPQFNDNNDAGTWTVTIVNPGGQSSSAFNFTVSGAAPSVSGVSPNPVPGSNNAQQLTINGSNFASGATATYHDPQGNSYPGHSTTFVNSGQLTDPQFNDNNDAGTWTVTIVNPGGQSSSAFNFTVSGAAPSVSGVSPNPVPGSNNAQQLTINGSNFASGATATYHDPQGNSYPGHSTTFVNSGQLTDPQFNDNNDAGTWTVTIVNPGGQSSSAFNFTVSGAAPSVSGVSPNPVPGSNNAQQLTINGSNFASGATATYHDPQGNSYPGHSTTFVNSGQLTDPQFNDNNDAGTWTVTIVNPGGQSSSAFNFTVSGAAPSVSGVSPNPVPGSNNAQQLTINGSNFASGATATYHDPQGNSYPGHSTTFVNSGQLTDPQFNDNNDAGTWTVTIVNPGGQSSSAFNFTVSGAAPSVSGVSPNPVPGSNNAQQLTINGSNFASGATATYHDPQGNSYPGHSTTFVNSGQLTDPQFNDNNDAGTWTVTIVNPGGQSSSAFNFTVSGAAPSVSGVSPNPVPGSNNAQQLTINGSNFASGATATYHDPQGNSYPGHSTTFVNSGQLTDPQFNDNNDAGTWTVTIVNPGGQSSSAFNFTVSGAAPSVSGVSPNPVPGSNNAQQLTINGSNFASGATATYHDPQGNSYPGHSTTFVNSGQLTDPQFNDNNDAGTWTVTIVNPGGQSSSAFNFTVSGAAPSVSGVSPNPVPGSNNAQQLTINGSNFASGATATYHDPQGNSYPGHSTTFVNSGQLTDPQFNDNNDAGTWTVTIVNPGGQSSSAFNFTVSGAAPSVSGVSPNPVPGSNNAQQLTINGSNFASGATATYHDPQGNSYPGHSTTFVNSGQLTDPQFNDNNDAGTWTVTIVNPGGQSSSAFNFTVTN
jgi:hypothetical protein